MIRFRLRTLLFVVSLVAIGLGAVVAHYKRQADAIAEFKSRDVYIYAEYDGPVSLRWLLNGSGIFVRSMQAQVLLQSADAHHVRFFGKTHAIDKLGPGLKEMQEELRSRLGLLGFAMVLAPQRLPAEFGTELFNARLADPNLHFLETPCGIENFPHVRREQE